MSIFVVQSQEQLLRGKRTEHGLRDDQARTEDAGERQERSVLFDNHSLQGFTGQNSFAARLAPCAAETCGSGEGTRGAHEGAKPSRGTQKSKCQTSPADTF